MFQNWIDVHDSLPGLGQTSLFVINGKVVCGEIGPSDTGYRIYTGIEFDESILISCISHWMPLPDLPKNK